ncbi:hypothetical protein C8Q80DRAFT_1167818 [Daedaleopsis nitida]|nr:hypothetical protein C8Q80DRAFT_1167818 [Daedaleopsis nitida]
MLVMNLPVDVFLEIASHLHPLDLLHLARVSNELRGMLMSRHMRSVWIAARKGMNPPMPDCPDDISLSTFNDRHEFERHRDKFTPIAATTPAV